MTDSLKRRAEEVLKLHPGEGSDLPDFARIVKAACEWREFWDPENGWCESRREALDAILRGEGPE